MEQIKIGIIAGDLWIEQDVPGDAVDYRRSLDLDTAIADSEGLQDDFRRASDYLRDPAFIQRPGDFDVKAGIKNEELRSDIQAAIDEANLSVSRAESIRKFAILPRDLTVADGELTPTLKVKRRIVDQKFKSVIDGLYLQDAWMGLIKPFFLGFVIVTIGCHVGLRARGGTQGVGRATTQAVVAASVAVLAVDFFVTKLIFAVFGYR